MGWLDQTMAALYKAALANSVDVQADQRRWLVQRNRCSGADDKIFHCVYESYRARFASIAAPYDQFHLTGHYEGVGVMDAVLFPDQRLSAHISSDIGPPSYNSCEVSFQAPFSEGKLHYVDPALSANDAKAGHCTIDMAVKDGEVTVTQAGCENYCGAHAFSQGNINGCLKVRTRHAHLSARPFRCRRSRGRDSGDRRRLCDVHLGRRRAQARARGQLEQRLVSALLIRGHQLYQ